jgi:hypothetical protein
VATLREQLAAAEAKAGEETDALREHVATLKEQLISAEAKAGEEANALRGHVETLKSDALALGKLLAAESDRADRAIGAFASLAERLEAVAAARARPWWRRLVG